MAADSLAAAGAPKLLLQGTRKQKIRDADPSRQGKNNRRMLSQNVRSVSID